jgi:hypothetical protein
MAIPPTVTDPLQKMEMCTSGKQLSRIKRMNDFYPFVYFSINLFIMKPTKKTWSLLRYPSFFFDIAKF